MSFSPRSRAVLRSPPAGQGLGRAFAKAFAATGAVAVIAERNGERGEAVAAEIAAGARHLDANSPRKMLKMLVGPGGLQYARYFKGLPAQTDAKALIVYKSAFPGRRKHAPWGCETWPPKFQVQWRGGAGPCGPPATHGENRGSSPLGSAATSAYPHLLIAAVGALDADAARS
jgi:hypothetical protein